MLVLAMEFSRNRHKRPPTRGGVVVQVEEAAEATGSRLGYHSLRTEQRAFARLRVDLWPIASPSRGQDTLRRRSSTSDQLGVPEWSRRLPLHSGESTP